MLRMDHPPTLNTVPWFGLLAHWNKFWLILDLSGVPSPSGVQESKLLPQLGWWGEWKRRHLSSMIKRPTSYPDTARAQAHLSHPPYSSSLLNGSFSCSSPLVPFPVQQPEQFIENLSHRLFFRSKLHRDPSWFCPACLPQLWCYILMLWTLLIVAATLFVSFCKSGKPAHPVFTFSSLLADSLSSVFAQISFPNSSPNCAAVTPCTDPSVFCFPSSLATASAAWKQEGPFFWFTDIDSAHWTVPSADGELHKDLLSKCEEIPCNLSIPCVPSVVPARFHAAFMRRFILVGSFGSLPATIFSVGESQTSDSHEYWRGI